MAKLRPLLGDLSGSVANNTFAHNRGGAYVRRRTVPVNAQTTRQTQTRGPLSTLSRRWATLPAANRAQWSDYAVLNPTVDPLGQARELTGQQCYVQLNARLLQLKLPPIDTPPAGPTPTKPNILTCVVTAPQSITLTFAPTPLGGGVALWVYASFGHSAGRSPNLRSPRSRTNTGPNPASPAVFTITTQHAWVSGQSVTVWVAAMDPNGRLSPPLRFDRVAV